MLRGKVRARCGLFQGQGDDAAAGDSISALTVAPNGDTPEFSRCETVVNGQLSENIFKNGFE